MALKSTPEQFQRALDLVKDPYGIEALVLSHDEVIAELMRIKTALQGYAGHQPLDLLSPAELQADLRAISGDPHIHRRSIGTDLCLICNRDLRDDVHVRAPAERNTTVAEPLRTIINSVCP